MKDCSKELFSVLIAKAFPNIELHIATNSFIKGCQTEFDLIISTKKGLNIPYSDRQMIFDINDVIAVFQVKSKISFTMIDLAYKNLRSIYNLCDTTTLSQEKQKFVQSNLSDFIPTGSLTELWRTNYGQNFVRSLFLNENIPLRVVIGYSGFKFEKTLRRNYVKYINNRSKIGKVDFGPLNWPDLLISGEFSLAKLDGKPLYRPINNLKDCWWEFFGSTGANPFIVLFAQLRTRLAQIYPQIYDYKYIMHDGIEVTSLFYCRSNSDPKGAQMAWELRYND